MEFYSYKIPLEIGTFCSITFHFSMLKDSRLEQSIPHNNAPF